LEKTWLFFFGFMVSSRGKDLFTTEAQRKAYEIPSTKSQTNKSALNPVTKNVGCVPRTHRVKA
jgi:hypothetical protein